MTSYEHRNNRPSLLQRQRELVLSLHSCRPNTHSAHVYYDRPYIMAMQIHKEGHMWKVTDRELSSNVMNAAPAFVPGGGDEVVIGDTGD